MIVKKAKIAKIAKDIQRVTLTHITRKDDDTSAYYCEESDEIILFYDVIATDALTHYNVWGSTVDKDMAEFCANFVGTRTSLHELFHYCGIKESKQCEYLAVKLTWGSDAIGKIVANWLYPKGKIVPVPEVSK